MDHTSFPSSDEFYPVPMPEVFEPTTLGERIAHSLDSVKEQLYPHGMPNEDASLDFTPGPWTAVQTPMQWIITAEGHEIDGIPRNIAVTPGVSGPSKANARLIAEAPELFNVLNELWWSNAVHDKEVPPELFDRIVGVLNRASCDKEKCDRLLAE